MLANQKYSSKTSLSLMLMGLLPFIFAIYYLEKYDFEIGLSVFVHYSAIILSFIGAINWGRNVEEKNQDVPKKNQTEDAKNIKNTESVK